MPYLKFILFAIFLFPLLAGANDLEIYYPLQEEQEDNCIEFSEGWDDDVYYISELCPDSGGDVANESDFEGSCPDACSGTPLPLYREMRVCGMPVFFGISHLPRWNEIPQKTVLEFKYGIPENQFWTAPKYIKTVSGLSP